MSELDKISKRLERETQKKNRLESSLSSQMERGRKAKGSLKFRLGEQVINVGLDNESNFVLLGLLHEAKEQLTGKQGENMREHWQKVGKKHYPLKDDMAKKSDPPR
jgi:hypothetical protein